MKNLKSKFHLTLVILITMANSLLGSPHAMALQAKTELENIKLDNKNQAIYNKNISNIYNNINIKYISIKLYNININNK